MALLWWKWGEIIGRDWTWTEQVDLVCGPKNYIVGSYYSVIVPSNDSHIPPEKSYLGPPNIDSSPKGQIRPKNDLLGPLGN